MAFHTGPIGQLTVSDCHCDLLRLLESQRRMPEHLKVLRSRLAYRLACEHANRT